MASARSRAIAILAIALSIKGGAATAAGKAIDGVVNLNTAPPAALLLLPGIGPAKVELIIAYRRRRPFRTVDELVRIKGIGRKMVRALRPHLAISGPTTATAAVPRSGAPPPPAPPPPPRPAPPVHAAAGTPAPARGARPPPRPQPRVSASASVPLAARASCLRPP